MMKIFIVLLFSISVFGCAGFVQTKSLSMENREEILLKAHTSTAKIQNKLLVRDYEVVKKSPVVPPIYNALPFAVVGENVFTYRLASTWKEVYEVRMYDAKSFVLHNIFDFGSDRPLLHGIQISNDIVEIPIWNSIERKIFDLSKQEDNYRTTIDGFSWKRLNIRLKMPSQRIIIPSSPFGYYEYFRQRDANVDIYDYAKGREIAELHTTGEVLVYLYPIENSLFAVTKNVKDGMVTVHRYEYLSDTFDRVVSIPGVPYSDTSFVEVQVSNTIAVITEYVDYVTAWTYAVDVNKKAQLWKKKNHYQVKTNDIFDTAYFVDMDNPLILQRVDRVSGEMLAKYNLESEYSHNHLPKLKIWNVMYDKIADFDGWHNRKVLAWKNKIYAITRTARYSYQKYYDRVICFDKDTGKKEWSRDIPQQYDEPIIHDGTLYFGGVRDDWHYQTEGSIYRHFNFAYLESDRRKGQYASNLMFALDAETGEEVLRATLPEKYYVESVVVANDLVYLASSSGWLYAIKFDRPDKKQLN